jgi:hypothetical protein
MPPTYARPTPPPDVLELTALGVTRPAPELAEWVEAVLLNPQGPAFNPDHSHLAAAKIGFLWTSAPASSKGRRVLGLAEIPLFRCGPWQKARQTQQIIEWFGLVPDFLITLDAFACSDMTDLEFMALVEHELYHCAQAEDEFGQPRFNAATGLPVWQIQGHDVDEFVGVVRRYGPVSEAVADLVIAAAQTPEVTRLNVARASGKCALKLA